VTEYEALLERLQLEALRPVPEYDWSKHYFRMILDLLWRMLEEDPCYRGYGRTVPRLRLVG
jgi:hypothetical protein